MKCHKCKNEIKDGERFCGFCGEENLLLIGNNLLDLGKFQEAIEVFDKILEIDLKTNKDKEWQLFIYIRKTVAFDELGQYQEAIDMFDRAIEIHPEFMMIHLMKANIFIKLEKYQEALYVVYNILKIEPDNTDALTTKEYVENKIKEAELKQATIEWKQQGGSGEVVEIFSKKDFLKDFFKTAKDRGAVIGGKLVTTDSLEEHMKMIRADDAPKYLFFDTETTGLPRNWNASVSDLNNWPRIVQIAWILCDKNGNYLEERSYIIKPEGFKIPADASRIHGITTEIAERDGKYLEDALIEFQDFVAQADFLVAHNMSFDEKIAGAEFLRKNMLNSLVSKRRICTKERSTNFCAIPSPNGFNDFKWPTLQELHQKLFGERFDEAHDALSDVRATVRCFWGLKKRGVI